MKDRGKDAVRGIPKEAKLEIVTVASEAKHFRNLWAISVFAICVEQDIL